MNLMLICISILLAALLIDILIFLTVLMNTVNPGALSVRLGKVLMMKKVSQVSYRNDTLYKEFIEFLINNPKFTHDKYDSNINNLLIDDLTLKKFGFLSNYNRKLLIDVINNIIKDINSNYPVLKRLMTPESELDYRTSPKIYDTFSYNKSFNHELSKHFNSIDPVNGELIYKDALNRILPKYYSSFDKNDEGLSELIDIEIIFNENQYLDYYLLECLMDAIIGEYYSEVYEVNGNMIVKVKLNRLQFFNLKKIMRDMDMSKSVLLMNEKIH